MTSTAAVVLAAPLGAAEPSALTVGALASSRAAPQSAAPSSTTCAPVLVELSEIYYTCTLGTAGASVDLSALPGVPAFASSAPITIQAWGGAGGSVSIGGNDASGGASGFAQTVTSLASLQSASGSTTIHYYLGEEGNHFAGLDSTWTDVGGGGSSTIVSTVDATTAALSTSENVLAIAGGGGGGAIGCDVSSCNSSSPQYTSERGGAGGTAMSNPGGANVAATAGGGSFGGGGGSGGAGGAFVQTQGGQNGVNGHDGIGGFGPTAYDALPNVYWANSAALATALGSNGAGANGPCMTLNDNNEFCISGGGGGGWGGGASGSNGNSGQYIPAGGGGGGSFAAPSTATDGFAPTTAPSNPLGGVRVLVPVTFESVFCSETTLAGTEGFRCVVPFDWTFTAPSQFLQPGWLATIQAVGGSGGNGGRGGQAQTTVKASDLAGETLYAYVGGAGAESTTNGGGGGGATVLATSPSVWAGASSGHLGPDVLLVAGGGGGGYAFGLCSYNGSGGGAGGTAIASSAVAATGNGGTGRGFEAGKGATFSGVWSGGSGASSGSSWMTFVGGIGGGASPPSAATTLESIGGTTPTKSGVGMGGPGLPLGQLPPLTPATQWCKGGGGGAGAAAGGGGGKTSTGGGGGSFAVASDVDASSRPSWAGTWLSLADQTQGQVSLFFYQGSQGPPVLPANGATVSTLQPTLGLTKATTNLPFTYVLTDETVSSDVLAASISSPPTSASLWSIPNAGALTPGHAYSWSVVDSSGTTIQAPQTFVVAPSVPPGTEGVVMNMRSINGHLPSNPPPPAYLKPEAGQKSATATNGSSYQTPDYWSLENPDSFSAYFTTATATQAVTNPGAVNMDWVTFDPFGLRLAQLFTLQITGALTVPISGSYTFGVEAFGGARLTLKDASGSALGGDPMVDSWGMIGGACYANDLDTPPNTTTDSLKLAAEVTCVNTNGVVAAKSPVVLVAGETYTFEVDGFMSWLPGPFRLLFSSDVFGADMTPVPGQWLHTNCTNCLGTPPPGAKPPKPCKPRKHSKPPKPCKPPKHSKPCKHSTHCKHSKHPKPGKPS